MNMGLSLSRCRSGAFWTQSVTWRPTKVNATLFDSEIQHLIDVSFRMQRPPVSSGPKTGYPGGLGPLAVLTASLAQVSQNLSAWRDCSFAPGSIYLLIWHVRGLQAMLEDLKSRQHKIEAERDRCRTACHMSDVAASREVIQDGIEKATLECKKVKNRLHQIEDVNAEIVESIKVHLCLQSVDNIIIQHLLYFEQKSLQH